MQLTCVKKVLSVYKSFTARLPKFENSLHISNLLVLHNQDVLMYAIEQMIVPIEIFSFLFLEQLN